MTNTLPMTNTTPSLSPISAKTTAEKQNKFEKFKSEKDGLEIRSDLEHFAQIGWEAMDETDRIHRLKWLGVFFRPVTPGKFMIRLRVPHGIITSTQLRVLADIVQRCGDDGCADVTTRQSIQLRGIRIEDLPDIFRRFESVGLSSLQSAMDNVRNITGSPVSGLEASELYDTRELVQQVQDMITDSGKGNPTFTNLPRKFNIAIDGGRENSVHGEINDVAFLPAFKGEIFGFNVLVGGFFSASRVAPAIAMNVWVMPDQVVALCEAILLVYRDHGLRANRQKARLMWLIDQWGVEKFREVVEQQIGFTLEPEAETDAIDRVRRDHIGLYPQQQSGLNYVGLCVPAGRLEASDMYEFARLAEVYGTSELRLTVEQNIIIPNVPGSRIEPLQTETLLQKFSINPGMLERTLVSCTGAQFCNFAMIETKQQSVAMARDLDRDVELTQPVRMHWTGCPNSCAQPQVADIGVMGSKARKNGKMVPGVDLFTGGKVGKDSHLGTKTQTGIAVEDLRLHLRRMLVEDFGATLRSGVVFEDPTPEEILPKIASVPAKVVLAKSGKTLDCTEADFILDVLEKSGLAADSLCRGGTCGTCKQLITGGVVTYDGAISGLTDADRASGYILACSAYPKGTVTLNL
jgi:ferredoxin-nitrite reductase